MKKRILSLILAAVILMSCGTAFALEYGEEWQNYSPDGTTKYRDVQPTFWGYNAIQRVSSTNWFSGYPDGTFRPNSPVTRAEALTVFVKFLGLELAEVTSTSYYDVKATDWYAPYIEAGKDLFPARTQFNGQTPFQPNMPVTREDAMYAIVKALGYEEKTQFADQSVLNMFSDKNSISSNIKAYVAVGVNEGLISGNLNGTIGAQNPLTRAEFATILYRATFAGSNN